MATSRLASFVPRASRWVVLGLTISSLMPATGCNGLRRSSMRPAFVERGYPAARPKTRARVILDEPVTSIESCPPGAPSIIDRPTSEPILGPSRAPLDSEVAPSRLGSPQPRGRGEEPDLLLPAQPGVEQPPRSNIVPPDLNQPSASRAIPRRTALIRPRPSTLQERVRPFVNDPEDLFQPPKADRPWKYIVVHHSAIATGSYDQIDRDHRKIQGWDGCGYHFVIGNGSGSPDGQIEVARRWSNQKHGLHCRDGKSPDVNEYGIGICLIGDLDATPPTPRQIAATRALVAYLERRYDIPSSQVGTHAEMAETQTACPGKHFPEAEIFGSDHLVAK